MFAIRLPTFWNQEGVNQYNSIIEQNQCVYIWRKYNNVWSLEPVCSHSFHTLACLTMCREYGCAACQPVNLCFWGGHFTEIHGFPSMESVFPNSWFVVNRVWKHRPPVDHQAAFVCGLLEPWLMNWNDCYSESWWLLWHSLKFCWLLFKQLRPC